MTQFDVYLNPNPETSKTIPYLLDVQADLLDTLVTRVVAPLVLAEEMGPAAKQLNPQFKIKGTALVMSTGVRKTQCRVPISEAHCTGYFHSAQ